MFNKKIQKSELDVFHKYLMKTFTEKGIKFEHDEALAIFKKHGAKVENDVVYIDEDLFKKAISTIPKNFVLKGREEKYDVEIGTGKPVFCPAYDPVYVSRNNIRTAGTDEDLINFSKLTQSSSVLNIMNPYVLTPTNLPPENLALFQQAACLKYGAKPNMLITAGYETTKECIQLVKKINSRKADDYVCVGLISSLSPLAFDHSMAGGIIALAEEKQPMIIGCYGLLGATAPVTFFDALLTTQAEILAGIVLAQLISPCVPCITGNVSGGSDMRFISPAIGSVEECKFAYYTKAISEYYGYPCRGGGSLCDAKQTDFQAGAESTLVMYNTLISGMDYIIHAVGILDSFNITGYEKFLLDEENIEIMLNFLNKTEISDAEFNFNIIQDVPHANQYIEHDHTYENMYTTQFSPKYALRNYYESWEQAGSKTLLEFVNEVLDKRLAEFEMPQLNAEKTAILDKLLKI